uniref:Uncharacterized protein n=1 Tax=viral metagenome TaxID=1070528 RepID=A0A6H2A680_9ZZZZ
MIGKTNSDIATLQRSIEFLEKRISDLESLHECACPSEEDQKSTLGWHCPLHGTIRIVNTGPFGLITDKTGGHQGLK